MSIVSFKLPAALLSLALCLGSSSLLAHEYKVGDLEIGHPWTRATPAGAKVAGGFMTLTNQGQQSERLLSASSPVAGHLEIHEMRMEGDVMRMNPLPQGLVIGSGRTVTLAPGGYHIMLMELKQPLEQGKRVPMTLTFEKAGSVAVELVVEAMGTRTSGHSDSKPHGHDHKHEPKKQ